jgi:hypothetical protein
MSTINTLRDSDRIHLVCYEPLNGWVLSKFAIKMRDHLLALGRAVSVGSTVDPEAAVNHHINYFHCEPHHVRDGHIETTMITHIDTDHKFNMIKTQSGFVDMGVCNSRHTAASLHNRGVDRGRLGYVTPGHDFIAKPRRLVLGITTRLYPSGCKREYFLDEITKKISPDDFSFFIMGGGWGGIVEMVRRRGFVIRYVDGFDPAIYAGEIPGFDYYLYFGQDEGSMGILDALSAGVPTISTPQGFHLDIQGGLTHCFNFVEELSDILKEILVERNKRMESVRGLTWGWYTDRHLKLWEYLITAKRGEPVPEGLRQEAQASML